VQDLLRASPGTNLGIDYLPGALGFDPVSHEVEPLLASKVLWFDAYIGNVDRSWQNPNLLRWHAGLWLIDHGASLTFAHDWRRSAGAADKPYGSRAHVLDAAATRRREAAELLAPQITDTLLTEVVAEVPDVWLDGEPGFPDAAAVRAAYVDHLRRRIVARDRWQP